MWPCKCLRNLTGPKGLAPCQTWAVPQDEVLAHRLGLVPLKLDPELFQDKAGAPEDICWLHGGFSAGASTSCMLAELICCLSSPTVMKQSRAQDQGQQLSSSRTRAEGEAASEKNTVVFKLAAACKKGPDGKVVNHKGTWAHHALCVNGCA